MKGWCRLHGKQTCLRFSVWRPTLQTKVMDYRTLLKKLEKTLEKIETSDRVSSMLQAILESIVKEYGKELGIIGGRIYEQVDSHYQLYSQTGVSNAPRIAPSKI